MVGPSLRRLALVAACAAVAVSAAQFTVAVKYGAGHSSAGSPVSSTTWHDPTSTIPVTITLTGSYSASLLNSANFPVLTVTNGRGSGDGSSISAGNAGTLTNDGDSTQVAIDAGTATSVFTYLIDIPASTPGVYRAVVSNCGTDCPASADLEVIKVGFLPTTSDFKVFQGTDTANDWKSTWLDAAGVVNKVVLLAPSLWSTTPGLTGTPAGGTVFTGASSLALGDGAAATSPARMEWTIGSGATLGSYPLDLAEGTVSYDVTVGAGLTGAALTAKQTEYGTGSTTYTIKNAAKTSLGTVKIGWVPSLKVITQPAAPATQLTAADAIDANDDNSGWIKGDGGFIVISKASDTITLPQDGSSNDDPTLLTVSGVLGTSVANLVSATAAESASTSAGVVFAIAATPTPGTYSVTVKDGSLTSGSVGNVAKTVTVQIGFKLDPSTDVKLFKDASTDVTGEWVNKADTITLQIGVPSGQSLSATVFAAGMADVPASTGLYAGATAFTGSSSFYPSTTTRTYVRFTMASTGLNPGDEIAVGLEQGVLQVGTVKNYKQSLGTPLKIGFVPSLSVTVGGTAMTAGAWLNVADTVKFIVKGAAAGTDTLALPSATTPITSVFASATYGNLFTGTASEDSGSTSATAMEFTVQATASPGVYTVKVLSGAFTATDGSSAPLGGNVAATFTVVNIGFTFAAADVDVLENGVSKIVSNTATSTWVNPTIGGSGVVVKLSKPASMSGTTFAAFTATAAGTAFTGATNAILTGNLARDSGGAFATVSLSASAASGTKALNIAAGLLSIGSSPAIFNAAQSAVVTVKVAWVPSLKVITAANAADAAAAITATDEKSGWINGNGAFVVITKASGTLTLPSTATDVTSAAVLTGTTNMGVGANAETGSDSTGLVFKLTTPTPGLYTVTVAAGSVQDSNSADNAAAVFTIQLGFELTASLVQTWQAGADKSAQWLDPALASNPITMRITKPTLGSFDKTVALNADAAFDATGNALMAVSSAVTYETTGAYAVFTVKTTAATGSKTLNLAAGKLKIGTAYNYAVSLANVLLVGWPLTVTVKVAAATASTTAWLNPDDSAALITLTAAPSGATLKTASTTSAPTTALDAVGGSDPAVSGLLLGSTTTAYSGTAAVWTVGTGATPGTYNVKVKQGTLEDTNGAFNAEKTFAVFKIGFKVTYEIVQGSSSTWSSDLSATWINPIPGSPTVTKLRILPPTGATAFTGTLSSTLSNIFAALASGSAASVITAPTAATTGGVGITTAGVFTGSNAAAEFTLDTNPSAHPTWSPSIGIHKINFKESAFSAVITATGQTVNSYLSVGGPIQVKIGFNPGLMITQATTAVLATSATDVKSTWINAGLSTTYVVLKPSGVSLKTTYGSTASATLYDDGAGAAAPTALLDGTETPTGTATYLVYALKVSSSTTAKAYSMTLKQGTVETSTSVGNYPVTVSVQVGWAPTLKIVSDTTLALAQASTTDVSAQWLDPATKIQLLIVPPAAITAPALNALPAGSTAWSGTAVATLLPAADTTASDLTNGIRYSLTTSSGTAAQSSAFKLLNGQFSTGSGATLAKNYEWSITLQIGFKPTIGYATGSGSNEVSGTWVNPNHASKIFVTVATPSTAFTNTVPAAPTSLTAAQVFFTQSSLGITAQSGSTTSLLKWQVPTTAAAGIYDLTVAQGTLKYTASSVDLYNYPTSAKVYLGWGATFAVYQGTVTDVTAATDVQANWLNPATTPIRVRIIHPQATVGDLNAAALTTTATTVFTSSPAWSTAWASSGAPDALKDATKGMVYALSTSATTSPAQYAFTTVQGTLCVGTLNAAGYACNYAQSPAVTVKVGFKPQRAVTYGANGGYSIDDNDANVDKAAAAALDETMWHDVKRASLILKVTFSAPLNSGSFTPAGTPWSNYAVSTSQANDVVSLQGADTSTGTPGDVFTTALIAGTNSGGVTVALTANAAGAATVEYTITFSGTTRPAIYTLSYKCDGLRDANSNVGLTDGCNDQTTTIRIGTAPTLTWLYVSGKVDGSGVTGSQAVTANGAVDTTRWHDTSSSDLVAKLTITAPTSQKLKVTQGAVDTVLKVVDSTDYSKALGSVTTDYAATSASAKITVTASTPTNAANNNIEYTVTFKQLASATAGAEPREYWLNLVCEALVDEMGNAVGKRACLTAGGGVATATSSLRAKIGFKLTKTVVYKAGWEVGSGSTWNIQKAVDDPVDQALWHNTVDEQLVVRVRLAPPTGVTLDASTGATLPAKGAAFRHQLTQPSNVVPTTTSNAAVSVQGVEVSGKYEYEFRWGTGTAGTGATSQVYTLKYQCNGELGTDVTVAPIKSTTGAYAVHEGCKTDDVVNVGFKPTFSFYLTDTPGDVSNGAGANAVAADKRDGWFSKSRTDLNLDLTVANGATLFDASYATATNIPTFSVSTNMLLKASATKIGTVFTGSDGIGTWADASLPVVSASTTKSMNAGKTVITWAVPDISMLVPGEYTFYLAEAALKGDSTTVTARSVVTPITLKVGFDLDLEVYRNADTDNTAANVITLWQDPCTDAPGAATDDLSQDTNDCDGPLDLRVVARTADTVMDDGTASLDKNAVFYAAGGQGRSWTATTTDILPGTAIASASQAFDTNKKYVAWRLATTRAATLPDEYVFAVKQGVITAIVGTTGSKRFAKNAATDRSVRSQHLLIGWRPVFSLWENTYPVTGNWINPANGIGTALADAKHLRIRLTPSGISGASYTIILGTVEGPASQTFLATGTVAGGLTPVGGLAGDDATKLTLREAPVCPIGNSANGCVTTWATYELVSTQAQLAGVYTIKVRNGGEMVSTVKQGLVVTNGARNYDVVVKVNVGFKPLVSFYSPGFDGMAKTDDDWTDVFFNAKHPDIRLRITVEPTVGVAQFAAATAAALATAVPATTDVDTLCDLVLDSVANPRTGYDASKPNQRNARKGATAILPWICPGPSDTKTLGRYINNPVFALGTGSLISADNIYEWLLTPSSYASLPSGQYPIDIAQGKIVTADGKARNFAASHRFKIGYPVHLRIEDEAKADVTTEWLDNRRTNLKVAVMVMPDDPDTVNSIMYDYSKSGTAPLGEVPKVFDLNNGADIPVFGAVSYTDGTGLFVSKDVALGTGTAPTGQAIDAPSIAKLDAPDDYFVLFKYPLKLSTATPPAKIPLKLRPDVYCNQAAKDDEQICNAHTYTTAWGPAETNGGHVVLKLGFTPTLSLQRATDSACVSADAHRGQYNPDWMMMSTGGWPTINYQPTGTPTRPIVSFSRKLCLEVASSSMTAQPSSLGWSALWYAGPDPAAPGYASPAFTPPAEAGAYTSGKIVYTFKPNSADGAITGSTALKGISAGTYDLYLKQGVIPGANIACDAVEDKDGKNNVPAIPECASAASSNARARIQVRLGPQLQFFGPNSADAAMSSRVGFSGAFTNLQAVRLRIEGTKDTGFEFRQLVKTVNRTADVSQWTYGEGDPASLLMTGLVNRPVGKNAANEEDYLYIDYLVGVTNLVDSQYVMDAVLQMVVTTDNAGVETTTFRPVDKFDQRMWDVTTATLWVDRTAPAGTTRTYLTNIVYAEQPRNAPNGYIKLDQDLFTDTVSGVPTCTGTAPNQVCLKPNLRITAISSEDDRGLILYNSQSDKPCFGANGVGCTLANAAFRTGEVNGDPLPVRLPSGLARFTITAIDEAGNSNTSTFIIPIKDRAAAAMVISDLRGKTSAVTTPGTLYVGSAKTRKGAVADTGDIPLTISVTYPEDVQGMVDGSLKCFYKTPAMTTGVACWTAGQGPKVSTGSGRAFTWYVDTADAIKKPLPLQDTRATINNVANTNYAQGVVYEFYVDATGITTSRGAFVTKPSETVRVIIDAKPPTYITTVGAGSTYDGTALRHIAAARAVVGSIFSSAVGTIFGDSDGISNSEGGSASNKIRLFIDREANAAQNLGGLQFFNGLQGERSTSVSGRAIAVPADGWYDFTVTAEDEAGNTATGLFRVIVVAALPGFTLTMSQNDITFREVIKGAAQPVSIDAAATWAYVDPATGSNRLIHRLRAYIVGAQADGTTLLSDGTSPARKELLLHTPPGGATTTAWSLPVGSITGSLETEDTTNGFSPAAVTAWLRSLQYSNNHRNLAPNKRIVRIEMFAIVSGSGATAAYGLISSIERNVIPVLANDPPVLKAVKVGGGTQDPQVTWTETTDGEAVATGTGGKRLFMPTAAADTAESATAGTSPTLTLADDDDTNIRSALVTIALTAGRTPVDLNPYKGCDPKRDRLRLPADYNGVSLGPLVKAVYTEATCTLYLTPAQEGRPTVTKLQMATALRSIEYWNADVNNPTNYKTAVDDRTRFISVTVSDDSNANRVPGRSESSNSVFVLLEIVPVDDPPVLIRSVAFTEGGLLSAKPDVLFANLMTVAYNGVPYKQRKFTLVLPYCTATAVTATATTAGTRACSAVTDVNELVVPFDLRKDRVGGVSTGALIDGSFGGGAVFDPDSADPIDPDVPDTSSGSPVTHNVKMELETVASDGTATWGALSTWAGVQATFVYYGSTATGPNVPYTGKLIITYDKSISNVADTLVLGQYKLRLTYDDSITGLTNNENREIFYVDIRREDCMLSTAANYLGGDDNKNPLLTCLTGANAQTCASPNAWYYPYNLACTFKPVTVVPCNPATETCPTTRLAGGDVTVKRTAMYLKLEALEALPEAARVAALEEERQQARGLFELAVPPGGFSAAGSLAMTALKVDESKIEALKPSITASPDFKDSFGTPVPDYSVALKLGPAGTVFDKPVKVCIFTGNTPAGSYKVMARASQRDPSDESQGYGDFEVLSNGEFDIATGQLCGTTTHFSLFVPITRPLPVNPIVPKLHLMGGLCPLHCSGHGTCREGGQCICFPGFESIDCSLRSCPSGESWGEDQLIMHSQSECSGRGTCDHAQGTCGCLPGFEGPACERMTCPSGCSGHGKCRSLGELAAVQKSGAVVGDWAASRIQRCVCDGGYTGPDCSERLCPFGDDVETSCDLKSNLVVDLTVSFGPGIPAAGMDLDGKVPVLSTDDAIALVAHGDNGRNYTAPAVAGIWTGADWAVVEDVVGSLRSLPELLVSEVKGSVKPASSSQPNKVVYTLTFPFGANQLNKDEPLSCYYNTLGSLGCPAGGCRPKLPQMRSLQTEPAFLPSILKVNDTAMLQQPAPMAAGDDEKDGVWGVSTTLVIRKYTGSTNAGLDLLAEQERDKLPRLTYAWESTTIYGASARTRPGVADMEQETPMPPEEARAYSPLHGPYGLEVSVDASDDTVDSFFNTGTGPWLYIFKWRLPSCKVSIVEALPDIRENVECGDRGLCNRETGECACFDGYTGRACDQEVNNV